MQDRVDTILRPGRRRSVERISTRHARNPSISSRGSSADAFPFGIDADHAMCATARTTEWHAGSLPVQDRVRPVGHGFRAPAVNFSMRATRVA
jgi:hypothetical protein